MPKAFNEQEKERIKRALLEKGRDYFVRYGLKKTSINELAEAVGIAKGTFYRFFDSKEALFMAIHEDSEKKLQQEMFEKMDAAVTPVDKLRTMLQLSFQLMENDPLLRLVFGASETEKLALAGLMASGEFQEHYGHGVDYLGKMLREWQGDGVVRDIDIETASNLIASTFFIYLQRPTLGHEMYIQVTDMLVDCLVTYLVTTGDEHE